MVSEVYMICHAYEAGVGKGRDGSPDRNPYPNDGGINSKCHEAWGYGYAEGRDYRADQPQGGDNE